MAKDSFVYVYKALAVVVSSASLLMLSFLFSSEILSNFLKIQALAITIAAISNLGALPFVASKCVVNAVDTKQELYLWLRRRLYSILIVVPIAYIAIFKDDIEVAFIVPVLVIWSVSYSFDLTDVGLVSLGRGLDASKIGFYSAVIGLCCRLLVWHKIPWLEWLVLAALAETLLKFLLQFFILSSSLNKLDCLQKTTLRSRRAIEDFPVFLSSLLNSIVVRADQVVAGAFLAGNEASAYYMASRLVDGLWFIPFTTINLILSRKSKNYSLGFERVARVPAGLLAIFLSVALCIFALFVVSSTYVYFSAELSSLVFASFLLGCGMFTSVFDALLWRKEADIKDKKSGLYRTFIGLLCTSMGMIAVWITGNAYAWCLASAFVGAKMLSLMISVQKNDRVRENFTSLFKI
ncbi:MAG: hypothetical protein ACPH15_02525 [Pseudomonadales bacterium]